MRNPAPLDRIQNADEINTSHFEEWDIQHVGEKFPLLATVSPFLLQRLGKANTRRRQIFKYNKLHNSRLKRGVDGMTGRAETIAVITTQNFENQEGVSRDTDFRDHNEVHESRESAPSTRAPTMDTQTTVATYIENQADTVYFDPDDEVSETSSAASENPMDEGALRIPEPPLGALDGEYFECPYCFEISRTPTITRWR